MYKIRACAGRAPRHIVSTEAGPACVIADRCAAPHDRDNTGLTPTKGPTGTLRIGAAIVMSTVNTAVMSEQLIPSAECSDSNVIWSDAAGCDSKLLT